MGPSARPRRLPAAVDEVGKRLGVLRKVHGLARDKVEPEWGPPESRIVAKTPGPRSVIVATWGPRAGWQICEEEMKKLLGKEVTAAQLIREARERS